MAGSILSLLSEAEGRGLAGPLYPGLWLQFKCRLVGFLLIGILHGASD